MAKKPQKHPKRPYYAQHFLKSEKLVRTLVENSSISTADTVYEIGPGRGIITAELAHRAKKVIAIEKDRHLLPKLKRQFRTADHVHIIGQDFLRYQIRDVQYKIFANIPYNITADLVRKILYSSPAPQDAYLIMQKEAARKFVGHPHETRFSILAKPYFTFEIVRSLRKSDFSPAPRVDSVLLHIQKRRTRLVAKEDGTDYRNFVMYGFSGRRANLQRTFRSIFTPHQWQRLAKTWRFPLDSLPTALSLEQWLGLFNCFMTKVDQHKRKQVMRRR